MYLPGLSDILFIILSIILITFLVDSFWLCILRCLVRFSWRYALYIFFILFIGSALLFLSYLSIPYFPVQNSIPLLFLIFLVRLVFRKVRLESKFSSRFNKMLFAVSVLITITLILQPIAYVLWQYRVYSVQRDFLNKDRKIIDFLIKQDKDQLRNLSVEFATDESLIMLAEKENSSALEDYVEDKVLSEELSILSLEIDGLPLIDSSEGVQAYSLVLGVTDENSMVSLSPWKDSFFNIIAHEKIYNSEEAEIGELFVGRKMDKDYFDSRMKPYLYSQFWVVEKAGVFYYSDESSKLPSNIGLNNVSAQSGEIIPSPTFPNLISVFPIDKESPYYGHFILEASYIEFSIVSKYIVVIQLILSLNLFFFFWLFGLGRKSYSKVRNVRNT